MKRRTQKEIVAIYKRVADPELRNLLLSRPKTTVGFYLKAFLGVEKTTLRVHGSVADFTAKHPQHAEELLEVMEERLPLNRPLAVILGEYMGYAGAADLLMRLQGPVVVAVPDQD